MSVNLEQTVGAGPGKVPPPPHPGRSTAASSAAAVVAPIFNNSRRVTFLEGTGSFIPSFRQGVLAGYQSSCFPGALLITLANRAGLVGMKQNRGTTSIPRGSPSSAFLESTRIYS